MRLNRDRLKGLTGQQDSYVGLCTLYEVLLNMTIIMSPFTPFFAEYVYQHLRKLLPIYKNKDNKTKTGTTTAVVPEDAVGRADSVHYIMLPEVNLSRLNIQAENNFKILQSAVYLTRTARERRRIRTTLPLKNVLFVSANQENVDALNYLKSYYLSEVNAWNLTTSTDWATHCKISIKPNFGELGAKLGGQMKTVAKAIQELSAEDISRFMAQGSVTVMGHELSKQDLMVKIEFKGDSAVYEACASDDGKLLIAIDTTCDDEVLCELKSRLLAGSVQKLRKACGLVVEDKIEVFYEEVTTTNTATTTGPSAGAVNGNDKGAAIEDKKTSKKSKATTADSNNNSSNNTCDIPLSTALSKHITSTIKRIKTFPLPLALKPKYAPVLAEETITDSELSKYPVRLVFTRPVLSLETYAVQSLLDTVVSSSTSNTNSSNTSSSSKEQMLNTVAMYIQSLDYPVSSNQSTISFLWENQKVVLTKDTHYSSSALSMVASHDKVYKAVYPDLPSSADVL